MSNDQSHDTRTTNPVNRLAQAIALQGRFRDADNGGGTPAPVGLIFSPNLDALPYLTSADPLPQEYLDEGWTHTRNSGDAGGPHYTPDDGYPDNHYPWELQDNPLSGESGKVLAFYKEAWQNSGGGGWSSDGVLYADLKAEYQRLHIKWKMMFPADWEHGGMSKIFRTLHFDTENDDSYRFSFFSNGHNAPMFILDYNQNEYGIRNVVSLRGDPQETRYKPTDFVDMPARMTNGEGSLNYQGDMTDLDGDGVHENPVTMIDHVTGELLAKGVVHPDFIFHEQVWGYEVWNNVDVYIEMNSAPGAMDGVLQIWVRGQLVFKNTKIKWRGENSPAGIGWNAVAWGGNDNWNEYTNEQAIQSCYYVKDPQVFDSLQEITA